MGIPASMRLRKPREFQEVRSLGHRIHCGPFIFQCRVAVVEKGAVEKGAEGVVPARATRAAPRLGIIASRRVGNAVKRNYGKRVFRELFRKHAGELPQGSELVVVLRGHYNKHSFADLEARLLRACRTIKEKNLAS
jgi:ribonuclease P protein component